MSSSESVSKTYCDSSSYCTEDNNEKKCTRKGSLLGPRPNCEFGPKAKTSTDTARNYSFENQELVWSAPVENVLIIKRIGKETDSELVDLSSWLIFEKKLVVFVEPKLLEDKASFPAMETLRSRLKPFVYNGDQTREKSSIDLILTLGGDGTILYAASLFQGSMPPVIAFNLGSLGFLAAHSFADYKKTIEHVLLGQSKLMLRSRLFCKVTRASRNAATLTEKTNKLSINRFQFESSDNSFFVLNEVVINRGASQSLSNFDLFLEGRHVTTVQGDGLIISTPTGSTAYAVAAGASMVHPNVPSIMVTPICPHSLSFRPIVVPSGVELKLAVSENARGNVCASFDGRFTVSIEKGDSLSICTCIYPAPCVCKSNPFDDWFDSIKKCLLWNSRQVQKSLETGGST